MSNEIEPAEMAGNSDETPPASGRERTRRGRRIVVVVVAVCLAGGGVGAAIAESGSSSGPSTPAGAVETLLDAADHSDLLGAIDAIAPGERAAIEPGFVGLVSQLERLDVLSATTNLNDVGGLTLQFQGIKTKTTMLSSSVAAVAITGGSVTRSLDARKLPIGSFVEGLIQGLLPSRVETSTGPVATGPEAIVTEKVGGTWYVSLGYTIAYDALRAAGRPAVPPAAAEAVRATGSSTPEGAVGVLLTDAVALDLPGLLGDLPPGEMGALQSYSPLFLGKAEAALAKVRSRVTTKVTGFTVSSSAVTGGTLVKVGDLGLSVRYEGITINYKGGCLTYSYLGRSVRRCAKHAVSSAEVRKIIEAFPPSLRGLVTSLAKNPPAIGFVTVQEGGRWFVSPVATLLDDVDASLAILRPQDLVAIAALAENRQEAEALARSLEKLLFGSVLGPVTATSTAIVLPATAATP